MTSPVRYDLDEEYRNALNRDASKESRLFSISHLNFMYPLDELVLDDEEDVEIRIAALECLELGGYTLYELDIDDLPKELALAVIGKYYFLESLRDIALNHPDEDYRLAALENKSLNDEETLKHIILNESSSRLRVAAARHPSLNDSEFLESIALNDNDAYLRQAAVSNYSTRNPEVLEKIIKEDDEDFVRISALENLVFKYNLFYPYSNRKFNFKRKFDRIAWDLINFNEDIIFNELNTDDEIRDLLVFDLLESIFTNSVNEHYDELRDNLIEYYERILSCLEKHNPFVDLDNDSKLDENGEFKKEVYDNLNLQYGDMRQLAIIKSHYDYGYDRLNGFLEDLRSLDFNSYLNESNEEKTPSLGPIEESFFIDLAYDDSNCEIVKLAIEALRDNDVLMDFIRNGKTKDIKRTAIKRSTDLPSLVDMAVNRIDTDIYEANLYDDDWVCDCICDDLDHYSMIFHTYDFYVHDLKWFERLFDNRLQSIYYDAIAEHYYRDSLSYCLFKRIKNYLDLAYILRNTRSYMLRDLIVYKIENPIVLAYIALNAIDERVRYAAYGRIGAKAILKYVYLKSEDFRIRLLYLSNGDDNDILRDAFLNEENDVLRKSILDNDHFKISPEIIGHCIEEESSIASYAENKFAKQFLDYRLLNRKFNKQ